jgi:hypothetical protein
MAEFLLTLGILAIVGFVVGVGVLLSKEYPKIAEFMNRRPVLSWPLAFIAGGIASYALVYLFALILLVILRLILGPAPPVQ